MNQFLWIWSVEKQRFSCVFSSAPCFTWLPLNEWKFVVALIEWIYFRWMEMEKFSIYNQKLFGNVLHHGYGLCKTFKVVISMNVTIDPNHIIKPTFQWHYNFWMNKWTMWMWMPYTNLIGFFEVFSVLFRKWQSWAESNFKKFLLFISIWFLFLIS